VLLVRCVYKDQETAFTGDENGSDKITRTNNDSTNEDDDNSDNELWSSYEMLPSEGFENNEHGANSENLSDVYFDYIFEFAK
jgi:hypothetical protein